MEATAASTTAERLMHALLQMRLATALHGWVEAGEGRGMALLPTSVRMNEYNVYGPDLLWFREERIPIDLCSYPEHVPDLYVSKFRSPGTWRYDVGAKKRVYEDGGVPELWLVDDTSDSVLVYRRSLPDALTYDVALEVAAGETLASPLLPEFALAVDELFKR